MYLAGCRISFPNCIAHNTKLKPRSANSFCLTNIHFTDACSRLAILPPVTCRSEAAPWRFCHVQDSTYSMANWIITLAGEIHTLLLLSFPKYWKKSYISLLLVIAWERTRLQVPYKSFDTTTFVEIFVTFVIKCFTLFARVTFLQTEVDLFVIPIKIKLRIMRVSTCKVIIRPYFVYKLTY